MTTNYKTAELDAPLLIIYTESMQIDRRRISMPLITVISDSSTDQLLMLELSEIFQSQGDEQ